MRFLSAVSCCICVGCAAIVVGMCGCSSGERGNSQDVADNNAENLPAVIQVDHDFGVISDVEVTREVVIKNSRDLAIDIRESKASCGCVMISSSRLKLAPGEESSVTVKVDARGRSGVYSNYIDLLDNVGSIVVRINVSAVINPREALALVPNLIFGDVGLWELDEKRVPLAIMTNSGRAVSDVRFEPPAWLTVERSDSASNVWMCGVSRDAGPGRIHGDVAVISEEFGRKVVNVSAVVHETCYVRPSVIFFGQDNRSVVDRVIVKHCPCEPLSVGLADVDGVRALPRSEVEVISPQACRILCGECEYAENAWIEIRCGDKPRVRIPFSK